MNAPSIARRLMLALRCIVAMSLFVLPSPLIYSQDTVANEISEPESAASDSKSADPTGTWKWQREFRDTLVKSTLKLEKGDNNSLSGTIHTVFGDGGGPGAMEPIAISDGKLDGNAISFLVSREFNGTEFTVDYEGKLADGKITGTYTVDFGNGPQEIEWDAERAIAIEDVVGEWSLSFEGPNGQSIESTLTLKKEGEALVGVYHSSFFGDAPMKDVKAEGGKLTWTVVFETDNGDIELGYSAAPVGKSMEGTITSSFGDQENETAFKAVLKETPEKQTEEKADADATDS